MLRREAIKKAAILLGGTIALPDILKAWETPVILNPQFRITAAQENLIAEIAEIILPTTDTPGAKAAGVPQFIIKMLADCYPKPFSDYMMQTLNKLDSEAEIKYGAKFAQASPENRTELTKRFEQQDKDERDNFEKLVETWQLGSRRSVQPFFSTMKSLTITGYFTSEIGATQALRYSQIPGGYYTVDYKKGDKAWAG
jgi:hypothetical protein